ncbi:unnamed protein product [Pseudo-nitzschia multistriata]|uniref:Dienelactone hydrolase domain-containing protein n=1 Tax=Pseudo-nitzschia multistriata TaxID=183589 RepID=A0A448Z1Z2_9STRA|nr:unnamed protein product [Pseudo-nitzschia multistriata]
MPLLFRQRASQNSLPRITPSVAALVAYGLCCTVLVALLAGARSFAPREAFSTAASKRTSPVPMSPSSPATESVRWRPLGPELFPSPVSPDDGCRYAKDEAYLGAVLGSWKTNPAGPRAETSPWVYRDQDGTALYGHAVRPIERTASTGAPRPGILLFHTAAGPQDVFLFQKAEQLAVSGDLGPDGCVVLVCDLLSDPDGWAWTPGGDRTRFDRQKELLFRDNARLLRARVEAAVEALSGDDRLGVDPDRLAGLGWCFGAHPILELSGLRRPLEGGTEEGPTAVALVSYHGVYRRDPPGSPATGGDPGDGPRGILPPAPVGDVLICTGGSDPFVSGEDLDAAKAAMEEGSYRVAIAEFEGAKHGFTNPAQDFNPNPAFGYDEHAATESWKATMELLKRRLGPPG